MVLINYRQYQFSFIIITKRSCCSSGQLPACFAATPRFWALSLISVFSCVILHNTITRIWRGCIVLGQPYTIIIYPIIGIIDCRLDIALHEQIAIRAKTIIFAGNRLPCTYRVLVPLFYIPPSVVIIIVLYPALDILTANPAVRKMEPGITIDQNTSGCLNYSACVYDTLNLPKKSVRIP